MNIPFALRPQAAADLLSISRTTLYRMIAAGEIVPVTVRGHKRIPRAEIERIVGVSMTPAQAPVEDGPDKLVYLR